MRFAVDWHLRSCATSYGTEFIGFISDDETEDENYDDNIMDCMPYSEFCILLSFKI